jgi:hypothetical protein
MSRGFRGTCLPGQLEWRGEEGEEWEKRGRGRRERATSQRYFFPYPLIDLGEVLCLLSLPTERRRKRGEVKKGGDTGEGGELRKIVFNLAQTYRLTSLIIKRNHIRAYTYSTIDSSQKQRWGTPSFTKCNAGPVVRYCCK